MRRFSSSDSGFTLIETIVAAAMMVVITGAAVSMLLSAMKSQPRVTSRADQIGDARIALEKIVNEVRQGSAITTATATKFAFTTYIHAASCTSQPSASATAIACAITYQCALESGKTTYACTRQVGAATATTLVSKLGSGEIFSYTPTTSPAYVGVKISLPASSGASSTVLEGGAALRNLPANLAN